MPGAAWHFCRLSGIVETWWKSSDRKFWGKKVIHIHEARFYGWRSFGGLLSLQRLGKPCADEKSPIVLLSAASDLYSRNKCAKAFFLLINSGHQILFSAFEVAILNVGLSTDNDGYLMYLCLLNICLLLLLQNLARHLTGWSIFLEHIGHGFEL